MLLTMKQSSVISTEATSWHHCFWRLYATTFRISNLSRGWYICVCVCDYKHNDLLFHCRSLCQKLSVVPLCPVFGPWPSAAPVGQRLTLGSTAGSRTTWSSSQRVWSVQMLHTTPRVWPSRSCTFWSLYLMFTYIFFCVLIEFCAVSVFQFLANSTTRK